MATVCEGLLIMLDVKSLNKAIILLICSEKLAKPIPDSCPHRPYFLSRIYIYIHFVYSLCFKIPLKPNPVYYGYRIDFLPQNLNFFVK